MFRRWNKSGRHNGRMAQLVEHIVHIDGVTGSSPVATTTENRMQIRHPVFFVAFKQAEKYLQAYTDRSVPFAVALSASLLSRASR